MLDGEVPVAIGRKALELLSVLAEAEGDLVTKDELMAAVWPNVIVEDNAIQVQIAALRKLLGSDADLLSTTHGLGYRLAVTRGATPAFPAVAPEVGGYAAVVRTWPASGGAGRAFAVVPGPEPMPTLEPEPAAAATPFAPPSSSRRGRLILAGAMAVALAVGIAWVLRLNGGSAPPTASAVAVERLRTPPGDGAAALFAGGLAGDLAHLALGEPRRISVVDATSPGQEPAGSMVLDGDVRTLGDRLHATVELHSASDRAIAWSASFEEPLADVAGMRQQAAAKIADVMSCVVIGDGGRQLDLETLRLYLNACDRKRDDDGIPVVREAMRQVVARAPGFSRAWAMLAVSSAVEALGLPPDAARAARAEAASAASRSLSLDPADGEAWVARGILSRDVRDWARREAALVRAAQVEPDNPQAYGFRAEIFTQLGREREALAMIQRGAMLDPLSPPKAAALASHLAYAGETADAEAQIDRTHRLWPHAGIVRFRRFYLTAWFGDPDAARRLLADPEGRPQVSATELEFIRRLIELRAGRVSAGALADFIRAHEGRDLADVNVVEGLAAAGMPDEALEFAGRNADRIEDQTDMLFVTPASKSLFTSPRFMSVAARLGLTRAWLASGKWPDFCTAPDAPYDCKAAARTAEAALANGARSARS